MPPPADIATASHVHAAAQFKQPCSTSSETEADVVGGRKRRADVAPVSARAASPKMVATLDTNGQQCKAPTDTQVTTTVEVSNLQQ